MQFTTGEWVAIIVCGAILTVAFAGDIYLHFFPLKKADKKADKYRYKSNF